MNETTNDDFGDEADDGLSMVSTGFYPTQEETLGPLQRLQKYWDSDNVFNRQMVARNLLDTLRTIVTSHDELEEGLKVLVCLSEDIEPMVRSELMEQIPHLAMFCSENRKYFPNTIQEIILPTVVRYLTDGNNQVRKTSQAALLVLLEQELISHSDMVNQVCPVIIQLSSQDSSDDYRTEAVADAKPEIMPKNGKTIRMMLLHLGDDLEQLMSKVSPLAGREITEQFFLPHFTVLCKDSHFHLRKVCAANIGDICNVVGQLPTQAELLPRFEALCQDGVWGVRKACAECFMTVSYAVSASVRKERLSPLFVQLLCDQSRWVRMAAFQNLGPFISTFADPSISGVQLVYNADGTVHIRIVDPEEGLRYPVAAESDNPHSLSKTDTFEIQQETQTHRNPTELSNVHASTEQTDLKSGLPHQHQDHPPSPAPASNMAAHQLYSGVNEVSFTPSGHKPPTPTVESTPPTVETPPGGGSLDKPPVNDSSTGSSGVEEASTNPSSIEEPEYNSFQFWRNPVPVVGGTKEDQGTEDAENQPTSKIVDDSTSREENTSDTLRESSNPSNSEDKDQHKEAINQEVKETDSKVGTPPTSTTILKNNQIISSASFSLSRPQESVGTGDKSQEGTPGDPGTDSAGDDSISTAVGAQDDDHKAFPVKDQSLELDTTSADLSQVDTDANPSSGPEDTSTDDAKSPVSLEDVQLLDSPDESPADLHPLEESQPTVGETINSHMSLQSAGVNVHRAEVSEAVDESETATNIGTMHVIGASLNHREEVEYVNGWGRSQEAEQPRHVVPEDENNMSKPGLTKFQNVIPEQLLEQYLSMTDPTRAQTVDTEIAKHCAYSLPGVALTLGRHNWPCIKEVYDTLASDMQWKVRRTLAFSIHEMALILGDEITSLDLVPIFNGFLKDLDEVRIGVLKHFADFVKLLRPQLRQQYLNRMNDFLTTDNQRNWRFRLELAEQLIDMCDFYSPLEVYDNIFHIAIELACDRVADVRFMAYRLISRVLRIVGASAEKELTTGVKQQLLHKFAQSQKWFERQAYVHICQRFLEEQSLDAEQFATDFLPSMLDLSSDPIPNVRITLARTLAQSVMPLVYFTTDDNPLCERLMSVLSQLASDEDMDVGYYSRLAPIGETTIPDEEPPV